MRGMYSCSLSLNQVWGFAEVNTNITYFQNDQRCESFKKTTSVQVNMCRIFVGQAVAGIVMMLLFVMSAVYGLCDYILLCGC